MKTLQSNDFIELVKAKMREIRTDLRDEEFGSQKIVIDLTIEERQKSKRERHPLRHWAYNTRVNAQELLRLEKGRYRYFNRFASEAILFLSQHAHQIVSHPYAEVEMHPFFKKGQWNHATLIKNKRKDLLSRQMYQ